MCVRLPLETSPPFQLYYLRVGKKKDSVVVNNNPSLQLIRDAKVSHIPTAPDSFPRNIPRRLANKPTLQLSATIADRPSHVSLLKKIEHMILIASDWPTQHWFLLLRSDAISKPQQNPQRCCVVSKTMRLTPHTLPC
jgi:hypothetical protein